MNKNILVGQSGGPTAVINASLCGVITETFAHKEEIGTVYGMRNGIQGFLKHDPVDLSRRFSGDTDHPDLRRLEVTPGAYLGSCRYKLPEDRSDPVYARIFEKLKEWSICYLLYIGGNDSMDTVWKLSSYVRENGIRNISVIGIPKTIDNDLMETDHTPGYGSAAKYVAGTVRDIAMDAGVYDEPSVTIVELMGRHSGWLTAASVLARKYKSDNPVLIYLPERIFSLNQFVQDVKIVLRMKQNIVVCVSEGIADENGTFICEYQRQSAVDRFGHKLLSSCGSVLEQAVKEKLKVKVRSIELNVNQRCCSSMLSDVDLNEAAEFGRQGVNAALSGLSGVAVIIKRYENNPYRVVFDCVDAGFICNREKPFPVEWTSGDGTDIKDEFLDYILPLVQGTVSRESKQGLPVFIWLDEAIHQQERG